MGAEEERGREANVGKIKRMVEERIALLGTQEQ